MKISDMNWMQVEQKLKQDGRAVVPMGSTEQHGYLRLTVDAILAERVACEAAEPLGVPVFPVLSYGITPYFRRYPGSISLRLDTYQRIVADVLESLTGTGFTRILFVNGHGGNIPGGSILQEWMNDHPGITVKWHNWWNAPRTAAAVASIDSVALTSDGIESPERILVWGAGAIGGTFAAYLRRAGLDVTVVDANTAHVQAIRERGLTITGPIEAFTQPLPAHTTDKLAGVWDTIFLC